jgi:hypothetical protein
MKFLLTKELVFLSLTCRPLKAIAENERKRRQDIDRLLSKVVNKSTFEQFDTKLSGRKTVCRHTGIATRNKND